MIQYLLYFLSGIITSTASMLFSKWYLSIIGASFIVPQIQKHGDMKLFYCWNVGFLLFSLSWFYPSMISFLDLNVQTIFLLFTLSILFLAMLPTLSLFIVRCTGLSNLSASMFVFTVIFIDFEWFRSEYLFLSWGGLGLSFLHTPFQWIYAYIGQYSIIAILFFLAYLLYERHYKSLVLILFVTMLGSCMDHQFTQPSVTQRVSIIQGPMVTKNQMEIFYEKETRKINKPSLIIWPETTLNGYSFLTLNSLNKWNDYLDKNHHSMIAGARLLSGNKNYYNVAVGLGGAQGVYFKHQLVPFGEFTPFAEFLKPIGSLFGVGFGGYSLSKFEDEPITFNNHHVDTFICYDLGHPRLSNYMNFNSIGNVVLNNEHWFPNSIQEKQMLNYLKLLSIQTQKPVLVSSVDGPSMILDFKGSIIDMMKRGEIGSINKKVIFYEGNTPWVLYSTDKWVMILLNLVLFGYVLYEQRQRKFY